MHARRLVLFMVVGFGLPGCHCGGDSSADGGTDAGADAGLAYDEFDAWRDLRGVIRASPDAVPARAEALVAAKDAQGLFALVRDDVALLPTTTGSMENAGTLTRWGARATLRGQAGTPRERAELLKDLYVRAGFTAEVVVGVPAPGATVTGLLARGPQRTVRYAPTADQLARWTATLPPDPALGASPATPLDADGGVRAAVLAQVRPLLSALPMPAPFDAALTEVPLVRVVVDGTPRLANPNVDGAVFGQGYTVDPPEPAPPATGERQLHVTLSAARSTRPAETFVLAEGTWIASDVAGRTVTAAFTTPMSRADAARTKVGDANAFIPLLLVRGDGLDADAAQALSVVGTPVLRDGARVERGPGGALLIDGEAIAAGPTADATLTSVATLSVTASAAAFPDVELLVSAKRGDGRTVPGLGSDAFRVQEGGANVVASLRRTSAGAPRVVLLFDRSTSIPTEFLDGAPAVGHAVADAIFSGFPGAQVQVATIDINGPTLAGSMVSTLAEVDAQLAALSGTGSEVWTALDALAESGATCVVAITDAVVDDAPTPEMLARLVAGPPVLLAGVGTVDAVAAARIAEVTRGQVLTGVTATSLPASVTGFLAERSAYDYRITYRAPTTGASPRQVTVSLRAPGTASGTASYVPPSRPFEAGALSALYLTVEADGHSVTRTLAGSARATATDREAVAGALFGRFVLGVEAGAPSFSTLFDEHLAERLQLEAGFDALRSGDVAAMRAAHQQNVFRVPVDLRLAAAALPGEASTADVTFVDGLTVTLHATRPVLDVKVVRRFDLLPLAPRETVTFTGTPPSAVTTERTAMLAAFESERFARSTRPLLAGKTLARYDPLTVEQVLGPAWGGVAYPTYVDYDVLAPSDGSVVAFWAVHRRTGQLIGVTPEGGVGEGESTEALVERLKFILDAAGRAGEAGGYNGIKAWADLESTKVELLGGVIMLFEGEGDDPMGGLLNSMCGAGLNALGGQLPGWDGPNMVPGDLESIFRVIHLGSGREVPPTPGPAGVACSAILGP